MRNQLLNDSVQFSVSVDEHPTFEMVALDMLQLSLEPQAEITVPFEALIPRAGAHNLQALKLTVTRDHEEIPYPLQQQWFVVVTDTS